MKNGLMINGIPSETELERATKYVDAAWYDYEGDDYVYADAAEEATFPDRHAPYHLRDEEGASVPYAHIVDKPEAAMWLTREEAEKQWSGKVVVAVGTVDTTQKFVVGGAPWRGHAPHYSKFALLPDLRPPRQIEIEAKLAQAYIARDAAEAEIDKLEAELRDV